MKKFLVLFAIFVMLFSVSAFASVNKPLQNLGKGLDNIVYGEIEVPDNINETNTKGKPAFTKCTAATNDGVGRGIARFVGGVWEVATFWYPEDSAK
jgi:putative exosortase-associated protein (TIGR04073 family)